MTYISAPPAAATALATLGLAGEDIDAGARAMANYLEVQAASIYSGNRWVPALECPHRMRSSKPQ